MAADALPRRGFRRIGADRETRLVQWSTATVYPDKLEELGLDFVRPSCWGRGARRDCQLSQVTPYPWDAAQPDAVRYRQMAEKANVPVGCHSYEGYISAGSWFARMKDAGCDAVVLGCTEIPLIMNDANSPLPTLDSTRLLARAALRRAVGASARAD